MRDDPARTLRNPRDWRPSRLPLAAAAMLVGGSAGYLALAWTAEPPRPATATPVVALAAAPPADAPSAAPSMARAEPSAETQLPAAAPSPPMPEPRIPRLRDPGGDQTPDLADFINPGEQPTMAQVIERLRANGVTGGLAAFSPPGTRPPLIGLAVPEDYPLPPGYVRHYQATDDGQRIEPILMYSPHVAVVADASGRPVSVPADRVVPPEAAPAGLPLRRIAVPPPAEPGAPGR